MRTALIGGRAQYRLPIGLEEPLALRDEDLAPDGPTLPALLKRPSMPRRLSASGIGVLHRALVRS